MYDYQTRSVRPVTDQEIHRRLAKCYAFLLQLAREGADKQQETDYLMQASDAETTGQAEQCKKIAK